MMAGLTHIELFISGVQRFGFHADLSIHSSAVAIPAGFMNSLTRRTAF
jgi:hypothetical protein